MMMYVSIGGGPACLLVFFWDNGPAVSMGLSIVLICGLWSNFKINKKDAVHLILLKRI